FGTTPPARTTRAPLRRMTPFAAEIAAARTAQTPWAKLTVKERLRPGGEFRRLLVDRLSDITAAILADVNRPPGQVVSSEVRPVADAAKFLETHAIRLLKPRRVNWRPMWLMGCQDAVH